MPPKPYTKTTIVRSGKSALFNKRKRTYGSKKYKVRSKALMPIHKGIKPLIMVELNYSELISLDPGLGSYARYNFRANDCYDPNVTSTGHQTLFFDR